MFHYLKSRLGIDVLEKRFQFYHKYWMQTEQRFGEMNDHLVEMKEIIKAHDVISEKKAVDRHIDLMARLGLVLTKIGKVMPVQTVTSGYMQVFPLEKTSPVKPVMKTRGRPKKVRGDEQ